MVKRIKEENIDLAIDRLITRTQATNEFFLKKIGNDIKTIGELSPSEARQLSQMLKYGDSYDEITEELARLSDKNVEDIYDIYEEVAKNDYAFARQFYNYQGVGYIPFAENYALQNQINAIAAITASEYVNLANANTLGYGMIDNTTGEIAYRNMQDTYYDLIDDAVMSVAQGKESFDAAMYRQLKTIGEGGLRVIYPSTYETTNDKGEIITKNRSVRLDSAIRMNMKQGLTSMHNELQNQFGQEFGADGVEISVHTNPAPDHAPYQGKQFSNKEYEELQASLDRPIGMMNCYHYNFAIVLGVSEPEYSQEELDRINEENEEGFEYNSKHYTNYEGTQMQRRLERKVREQKDNQILAKASGNNQLIKESQDNIKALTDEYKKFSAESGLPTKMQRMRVSGYQRTKVESMPKSEVVKSTPLEKYNGNMLSGNATDKEFKQMFDDYEKWFNKLDKKELENAFDKYQDYIQEINNRPMGNTAHSKSDPLGEFLNKNLGYDGLPELINKDSYWIDEFKKPTDDYHLLDDRHWFRGISGENAQKYIEQFKTGNFFAGEGYEANGTYVSSSYVEALSYANDNEKNVIFLTPKDNAKIVPYDKINTMRRGLNNEFVFNSSKYFNEQQELFVNFTDKVFNDDGYLASLFGFDIIDFNPYNVYKTENKKVILNRASVKVVK